MNIIQNALYAVQDVDGQTIVKRVLRIVAERDVVVLYTIGQGDKGWPELSSYKDFEKAVSLGSVKRIKNDPFARLRRPDSDFSEVAILRRDRIWDIVSPLLTRDDEGIFISSERGQLIKEVIRSKHCAYKDVLRFLRRYWERGQIPNALIPDYQNCGTNSKPKEGQKKRGPKSALARDEEREIGYLILPPDEEIMSRGLTKFYLNDKRNSLDTAITLTLERFYPHPDWVDGKVKDVIKPYGQRPSEEQIRHFYYEKMRDPKKQIIMREGIKRYNLRYRPTVKDSRKYLEGPGHEVQIDSTPNRIWLVGVVNPGRVVGKGTTYFAVDVFSWLIMGFRVSLGNSSWEEAAFCIINIASDKAEVCKQVGIPYVESEWPCQEYLPRMLKGDGAELKLEKGNGLVNAFGVDLVTTRPDRADDKGTVEKLIDIYEKECLARLPGFIRDTGRRTRDYRLDARLNLLLLREAAASFTHHFNNYRRLEGFSLSKEMIRDGVEPYPTEIWNWGIRNLTGCLEPCDPELVKWNLMPRDEASVTGSGINYKEMYYTSELAEKQDWFVKAEIDGSWTMPIVYDPLEPNMIYLRLNNGLEFEPCTLADKRLVEPFQDATWPDIEDEFLRRTANKQRADSKDRQKEAEYLHALDELSERAEKMVQPHLAGLTKRERVENRTEDRKREHQLDRQGLLDKLIQEPARPVEERSPVQEATDLTPEAYIPAPDLLDKLRDARNKSLPSSEQ